MDKGKSVAEQNGLGICHANGLQNGFHSQPLSNGTCAHGPNGSSGTGSSGSHSGIENFHHLHQDLQNNGSPAKRCRLRRRMDSGKKNRPRKWAI